MEVLSKCTICGSSRVREVGRGGDLSFSHDEIFVFSVCLKCHVFFLSTRPREDEAYKFYGVEYDPYTASYTKLSELFIRLRTLRELDSIVRFLPPRDKKRLLEIGSSWGKYLLLARNERNFEVVGVEMSNAMCQKGREEHGLLIYPGDLRNQDFSPSEFDVVVMNHVLEHLYHPKETIAMIAKILNKRGVLLLRTPVVGTLEQKIFGKYWHAYEFPRHVTLFSEKNLVDLLEQQGFEIKKIRYEGVPNNLILSFKNFFQMKLGSGVIANLFSIKNPLMLALFSPLSFLLGFFHQSGRIMIIAQKHK